LHLRPESTARGAKRPCDRSRLNQKSKEPTTERRLRLFFLAMKKLSRIG
jgi:hypothetical protein